MGIQSHIHWQQISLELYKAYALQISKEEYKKRVYKAKKLHLLEEKHKSLYSKYISVVGKYEYGNLQSKYIPVLGKQV